MSAPIIFVHSGCSDYLRYTMDAARLFNPDKEVILLGDDANKFVKLFGVTHVQFSDYAAGPEIETFEKVFQFCAGSQHGRPEWTKFGFKRFYYLWNYVRAKGYPSIWNVDSDTLILTQLSAQEHKFKAYDCTSQCNGSCLSGFLNNTQALKGYVDKTNEVFQRTDYMNQMRKGYESAPHFAFTDMATFDLFKVESPFKIMRLNTIINGETFDDCICQQHDMEMQNEKLKKLYLGEDGSLYTKHLPTDQLVKINTINMSWVPTYLIAELFFHSMMKLPAYYGGGSAPKA